MSTGWSVGERVLIPDDDEGWLEATVEQSLGIGRLADLTVRLAAREGLVKVKGSAVERFGSSMDTEDLATLENLTEGSMLHSLRMRYSRDAIYTSIGGIVIAVNPFRELSQMYGEAKMNAVLSGEANYPHPYLLAEVAARGLCRDRRSQSLLISGESGAGKTETVKHALRYLAHRSYKGGGGSSSRGGVDEVLLKTNPVLEAFANAKTVRNDNSSRVGKYVRVHLDAISAGVRSASITTYLLEKTRVVDQLDGERNYHVFYQHTRAAGNQPRRYAFLTQGGVVDVAGVDDAKTWQLQTEPALRYCGVMPEEKVSPILKATIALGELDFEPLEIEGQDDGSRLVGDASGELGVTASALSEVFTTRQVGAVRALNSVDTARRWRDALAKALYARLFDWLVARLNGVMAHSRTSAEEGMPMTRRSRSNAFHDEKARVDDTQLFIGLLDIFGFESFERNSLEQLLINYANERLQAHFNAVIFTNEAREYAIEGVSVSTVEFVNNASIIEAIEQCVVGPLEDECALRSGSDTGLVDKFLQRFAKSKQKNGAIACSKRKGEFVVKHFAGDVSYASKGLVAKNRDVLPDVISALAASSSHAAIAELMPQPQGDMQTTGARRGRTAANKKLGVARSFAASLKALADTIELTEPHFVRCVKPNARNVPNCFHGSAVQQQLRYMGVFQIVEARRRGYARRYEHAALRERFYEPVVGKGILAPDEVASALRALIGDETGRAIAVGRSKTFLKIEAHDALEAMRENALRSSALKTLMREDMSADELDVALRIAVGELRLCGTEIDEATARLNSMRFADALDKLRAILDQVAPDLGVERLTRLLDAADSRLDDLLALPLPPDDSAINALDEVKGRADALNQRLTALDACLRAERDANSLLEAMTVDSSQLGEAAVSLEACLFELNPDVLRSAPEALSATAALQLIKEALAAHSAPSQEQQQPPSPSIFAGDPEQNRQEDRRPRVEQQFNVAQAMEHHQQQRPPVSPKVARSQRGESPRSWLDDSEVHAARNFFMRSAAARDVLEATNSARLERLLTGVCTLKFKNQSSSEWKLLRLSKNNKLTWQPLAGSSASSIKRAVTKVRSDGTSGVSLESVTRVCIGPEVARPQTSIVDTAHNAVQRGGVAIRSRWHYLTISTAHKDYIFGFVDDTSDMADSPGRGVIDASLVELLYWAVSIERFVDTARNYSRTFGDGCLARAQRVYVAELFNKKAYDAGRSPLARLCPVLRPIAFSMAQTVEAQNAVPGAPFGARAPEHLAVHASWLPAAVLEAQLPDGVVYRVVSSPTPGFRLGEVLSGPPHATLAGCSRLVAIDTAAAYAVAKNLGAAQNLGAAREDGHHSLHTRRSAGQRRLVSTRAVPLNPTPVDLFVACAKLDADLVEALVIRCRLRVNSRYCPPLATEPSSTWPSWVSVAGEGLATMEPQRNMTALCYVVTWCDILGETAAERVIRRLLLLRADPEIDDGHPIVRFPPTASAIANGSLIIVRTLLHSGASPDGRTSDGRALIHVLTLTADEQIQRQLLEALVNSGADVNARIPSTGDTLLHLAAKEGLIDLVLGLVEFQANTLLVNGAGLTAAEAGQFELHSLAECDYDGQNLNTDDLQVKIENVRRCVNFLA